MPRRSVLYNFRCISHIITTLGISQLIQVFRDNIQQWQIYQIYIICHCAFPRIADTYYDVRSDSMDELALTLHILTYICMKFIFTCLLSISLAQDATFKNKCFQEYIHAIYFVSRLMSTISWHNVHNADRRSLTDGMVKMRYWGAVPVNL